MERELNQFAGTITGLRLERNFTSYNISYKVGSFYTFDYTQISNQSHYHDCFELVFLLSGKGNFIYKNERTILTVGDIFISDPNTGHEIYIDAKDQLTLLYVFINISKKNTDSYKSYEEKLLLNFLTNHKNILKKQYQITAYISFFQEYLINPKFKSNRWFLSTFENFIFNCFELLTEQLPKDELLNNVEGGFMERALDYIDRNLERKLTAEEISKNICTSKRNLYFLFRKNINMTVNEYINSRKISLAEHYLKMNLSITETANLIGIETLSQFNKLFKKYINLSPSEYKKKHNQNKVGYGRRWSNI